MRAAVFLSPTGEYRHKYAGPVDELLSSDLSSLCPAIHVIDDLIRVSCVGGGASPLGSPWAFFDAIAPAAVRQGPGSSERASP